MQVQPYFPEPEVVANCVATQAYDPRLKFVRRVMILHGFTVALVGLAAVWLTPLPGDALAPWVVLAVLLLLSFTRRVFSPRLDLIAVVTLLPILIAYEGRWIHQLSASYPISSLGIVYGLALVYGLFCGRDYSFLGQFGFAGGFFLVGLIVIALKTQMSWRESIEAAVIALVALGYYVYDLASLLSRRRLDEPIQAVADLYRDLLNILTYSFRVIHHWRNFKI